MQMVADVTVILNTMKKIAVNPAVSYFIKKNQSLARNIISIMYYCISIVKYDNFDRLIGKNE